MQAPPVILCIGGHDPTGGAGIQADIETVGALGGRTLTLVTALTAQDTGDIVATLPTPAGFFARQLEVLLRDIRPDAVKLGLLGSVDLVALLCAALDGFDGPVVLDPVLAAGGGFDLDRPGLSDAIRDQLLARMTLVTPNWREARRLGLCSDPAAAAQAVLGTGAGAVLLTGADEAQGEEVHNLLFLPDGSVQDFSWPRLPHAYHGSGCTLASACAMRLALGDDLPRAVGEAQAFTWQALASAARVGGGQHLPRRLA